VMWSSQTGSLAVHHEPGGSAVGSGHLLAPP
jgi:hypothetical protein